MTERPTEVQNACAPHRIDPATKELEVIVAEGSLYVRPQVLSIGPIAVATRGTILDAVDAEGEWYSIRFIDRRHGERFGYIHCAQVKAETAPPPPMAVAEAPQASAEPEAVKPVHSPPLAAVRPNRETPLRPARSERRAGYLEWRQRDYIIVDGQRVRWTAATKISGAGGASIAGVPLGYEATFVGRRTADGSYLADQITVKPNGSAMYERDVVRAN